MENNNDQNAVAQGVGGNNDPQSKRERRRLAKLARQSAGQTGRLKRKFLPWLIVIIVIGLSVWGLSVLVSNSDSGDSGTATSTTSGFDLTKPRADDWVRGNREAVTVLVEYSDFECPACAAYAPVVKRLVDDLGADFAFVYRHFPLSQHRNAKAAAAAAEAAGRQGKFWEMADFLFDNQESWEGKSGANKIFAGYAKTLGLDESKFATDFDSSAIADRVESNRDEGFKLLVNSTPTFFLNGQKITKMPGDYDEFKKLIADSIASHATN